jgi:hypothetical protein
MEIVLDYFMPSIHTTLKTNMYIYYSTLDRFREHGLIVRRGIQYVSPKQRYLPVSLHGVTTQKNNIVTFTAVRISTVTNNIYCSLTLMWNIIWTFFIHSICIFSCTNVPKLILCKHVHSKLKNKCVHTDQGSINCNLCTEWQILYSIIMLVRILQLTNWLMLIFTVFPLHTLYR